MKDFYYRMRMILNCNCYSIEDCYRLQRQLDAFSDWCILNRMEVNPSKCSVISFSRIKQQILHKYSVRNTVTLYTVWRIEYPKNWQRDNPTKISGNWAKSFSFQVTFLFEQWQNCFFSVKQFASLRLNFTEYFLAAFCSKTKTVLLICSLVRIISYNSLI